MHDADTEERDGTTRRLDRLLDELFAQDSSGERFKLQRVLTCIRLVRDETLGRGREVAGQWAGARSELEAFTTRRSAVLLEALLVHALRALLPTDTFLQLAAPELTWHAAWNGLLALRAQDPNLPPVPAPGEAREDLFERLLRALEERGSAAATLSYPRAMRAHVDTPVEAHPPAADGWRRILEGLRKEARRTSVDPRAALVPLRGLCAALLERGDVRAVRDLCRQSSALIRLDAQLSWMQVWATLLSGEEERARNLARELVPWSDVLPTALCELRGRHPAWADLLGGQANPYGAPPKPCPGASRRSFSAAVFAVFALDEGEGLRTLVLEASPGLEEDVVERIREREGAWRRPAEPEHELFTTARAVFRYRESDHPLVGVGGVRSGVRGALGGRRSMALTLVPIHDAHNEVAGWVHLECEHGLLPSAERLACLARSFCRQVELVRRSAVAQNEACVLEPVAPVLPRERAARRLLQDLGVKLSRRRMHLVEIKADGSAPAIVCSVGQAFTAGETAPGARRALARARLTGAPVYFDSPDPSMGFHAAAAAGGVVPLCSQRKSFLVCESTRQGDQPLRSERIQARLPGLATDWSALSFRHWHAERYGFEPAFDPHAHFWSARAAELRALASARSPLCILGPPGSGKEFLARYLHFNSALRDAPLALDASGSEPHAWLVRAHELSDEVFHARMRRGPGLEGERLILLSSEAPAEMLARGLLPRALGEALGWTAIEVPALEDRRDEIPALVAALAKRFAVLEGSEPPRFGSAAIGLLWRGRWAGNVRQLAELVYRLVLSFPGEELSAETIVPIARSAGAKLRERMPSLRPRRLDLELALRTNPNACGTPNKTRAAQLLGWDPDTLARRLKERDLL